MQSFKVNGSAGASGAKVTLSCSGYGGFAVQVIGTYSGTLTFEGSIDGENFSVVTMTPIGTTVGVTTTTSTGIWRGCCVGLSEVQARMSSYSSGTAVITILAAESSPTLCNLT